MGNNYLFNYCQMTGMESQKEKTGKKTAKLKRLWKQFQEELENDKFFKERILTNTKKQLKCQHG